MTDIYSQEPEERKEYLADLFKECFSITKSDTYKEFEKKLLKYASMNKEDLTTDQKNMLTYLRNEDFKDFMKEDIYERILNQFEEEFKEDYATYDYKTQEGKNYAIAFNPKTGQQLTKYGFIKGSKKEIRVEKILKKGKLEVRGRAKNGQFASFTKGD